MTFEDFSDDYKRKNQGQPEKPRKELNNIYVDYLNKQSK